MRLFEKAKRLGIWNPSDIDFSQDTADWQTLTAEEQDLLCYLLSHFAAGEEAVTLDLLPLILAIANEGRLEEEMYLTTFLVEEAKHVDFFSQALTAILGDVPDLSSYHGENYRDIFYDALPTALQALRHDPSAASQVRASMTYNMIVEGMLAETGYHAFFTILEERNIMPGIRQGVRLLKQDESRHIAYGIYLLSRLISKDDQLWDVVEETMDTLFLPALGVVGEPFDRYGDDVPFGLEIDTFIDYATNQFNKRIARVEAARGATLSQIAAVTADVIAQNDA